MGGKKSMLARIRQFGKEISILISWSLESSIEGADSMEARGYGLPGRTSFHLYRFTSRDGICVLVMLIFAAGALYGMTMGRASALFYPVYVMPPFDIVTVVSMACFAAMLAIPPAMDLYGELRWRRAGQGV